MKRLLLTVPLIVGLAYPASGEDPRDPLRIFYDKEEYADNLWGEVCWERVATLPENQEWKAQMQRYNDRLEQMTNLMNACASSASSVASDCVILVYITHEETMPLLDHFTAYLEENGSYRCLSLWHFYFHARIETLDMLNTGLVNILLSGD